MELEAFQRDVLAFFATIPEPPLYRRRDDPSVARAGTLHVQATQLQQRAAKLGAAVQELATALNLHTEALSMIAAGRVEPAEPVWREALAVERQATARFRLWKRTDAERPPIFDPRTATSRFDPRPDARVDVKLACPACRKLIQAALAAEVSMHPLRCAHCTETFQAYVCELRSLELVPLGTNRRRYVFRVIDAAGQQTRVEFDDATPETLGASPRNLIAFLYAPAETLRGVLNLDTSRVLWLSSSRCFVATVAFGEGAPELTSLRAFRDRVLEPRVLGRRFVRWYYREGPAWADWVQQRSAARAVVRFGLRAILPVLERMP